MGMVFVRSRRNARGSDLESMLGICRIFRPEERKDFKNKGILVKVGAVLEHGLTMTIDIQKKRMNRRPRIIEPNDVECVLVGSCSLVPKHERLFARP